MNGDVHCSKHPLTFSVLRGVKSNATATTRSTTSAVHGELG